MEEEYAELYEEVAKRLRWAANAGKDPQPVTPRQKAVEIYLILHELEKLGVTFDFVNKAQPSTGVVTKVEQHYGYDPQTVEEMDRWLGWTTA